ncbi:MAG: hypothetical protein AAF571_09235, partial [Verrucomicrobiota bacterium]
MKSFPKHLVVAIVLLVVAALAGGGLWFWTGGQLSSSMDEKTQLERKIKTLGGKGIFPNKANLDQILASTGEIKNLIDPVDTSIQETSKLFDPVRGTANADGNYPGLSANDWKQLLGEKRDTILLMAEQKNVALPEVFYLGFERYRALTPNEAATLDLGVQLL